MRKTVRICSVAFVLSVILAVLFLMLAACVPQSMVESHIRKDLSELHEEGMYSLVGDRMGNSILPMSTEVIMLMEAMEMNREDLASVLENPYLGKASEEHDMVDALEELLEGSPERPMIQYVHYWMGFRVFLRPLLAVFGYYEVRRLVALIFWSLLVLAAFSLNRNCGEKIALAFLFSMILVKPHVICMSLAYACCFLIAFSAILLMPYWHRRKVSRSLIFLELGIVTMFLDFYTVPIITFGLPLISLFLLDEKAGRHMRCKEILGLFFCWGIGYLAMWLAKLGLTTMFTSVNAFANAGMATGNWLAPESESILAAVKVFINNLKLIAYGFYQYAKWLLLMGLGLVVFILWYLQGLRRGTISRQWLRANRGLLLIGCFALFWFVVSNRPAAAHYGSQYRTVVLLFFALGAYFGGAVSEQGNIPFKNV